MTPVAACVLALMLVAHGADRRFARLSATDNATFFATVTFNASSSNTQTVALSKSDENVEWNVWPHPVMVASAGINHWSGIPTNR